MRPLLRSFIFLAFAQFAWAAGPNLAWAAGPNLAWAAGPNFDPNILWTIEKTSATSNCIGDPKNAICAVETYLACIVRLDHHLCDKIGYHGIYLNHSAEPLRYRILSYRTIRSADIPADLEGNNGWRPGNVEITILDLRGIPDLCPQGCPYRFIARPTLAHWELVEHSLAGF